MNLKIEIRYLNISNYPNVARYLEDRAREGWLLTKVIRGIVFIFKRIEPEELEFSISPYEVETAFTKKSKDELKEFESVCESVGWNYCTTSYDLHIYFRRKGSESLEIHTDIEEEFSILKSIGKRQVITYFFLSVFLIILGWFNIGRMDSVYFMKNGFSQLGIIILPMGLILTITDWIHLEKFLDRNEDNIELGKDIEYSDSKFYIHRFSFAIVSITILLFIIHGFYLFIYLKNKIMAIALIPIAMGVIIGSLYRKFVKPIKTATIYKVILLGITIFVAIWLQNSVRMFGLFDIENAMGNGDDLNGDKYRILSIEDFDKDISNSEGTMMNDASILVPRSYEHFSTIQGTGDSGYVETAYSRALTENIAIKLFNRYISEARKNTGNRFYPYLSDHYE
ncbi:MAG: DUF2812 domain-containing protein, partial [Tissierellia bacterium]|nr:DUF2812 domain-containing protein [Tissierellia bacterium]